MGRVFTKSVKMLILTMMSIFVLSATAAVYYSLDIASTVTTAANDIYFVEGTDNATAGVTIFNDNKSSSLAQLKAYPNITMTYDDPLKVRNNNTVTNHFVRLTPVSLVGNAANFVFINFTLQTSTKTSLNYTSNGVSWTAPSQTSFVQVDANQEYSIVVQTMANATAVADQTAVIEINVDVEM
ncbi:MAG: hypothetical protein NWE78_00525 [Candidatus Bathyarchaeota archaeon]|nr:hypothetical protein [Candidatus Bathyarchaeota archaeon]